jgi:YgiT-type zinc finger domain-containing protein
MARDTTKNAILQAQEAPHTPTHNCCPNCGSEGTLHRETRDELIEVDDNVVIVRVEVDVCKHCALSTCMTCARWASWRPSRSACGAAIRPASRRSAQSTVKTNQ